MRHNGNNSIAEQMVIGITMGDAAGIGQVDDADRADLSGCGLVSGLGVYDDDARPRRT